MSAPTHIRLVRDDEPLPAYPDELLDAHAAADYFTAFWHDRYLNSKLHLSADLDVQGAALNLFFIARKQLPMGSLPNDHTMLAKLLRIDIALWHQLMGRTITPLHNWRPYRAGGVVVLGHPVVVEVALDAVKRREAREVERNDKATSMRLKRLGELMVEIGCHAKMAQDRVLLERLDGWLLERHRGQRRMPGFEVSLKAALRHAETVGWFNKQR
ncbi:hypothetical protein ACFO5X_07295 [Seohaeicola nanhaiensis]|uniref:Uncharacterized protein n=1 Tax=Seohaeicola nanhaiensis TaxID=1387282 RepID=A0ABV9KDQ7_9RHOB